jgi:protein SCO1
VRAKRGNGVTAAAALLVGALALLTFAPAFAAALWGADYFPNVPLITQDGVTVHLYDDLLKDKAVAINVMYTACKDECPLETARLAQVQKLLGDKVGKDIFFYSITIDPKRDTPAVLKAYAEKFNVGPGWLFLTGKEEDIKVITKKLGLSRSNDSDNKDGHLASLMLGNVAKGQWMRNSAVDNPRFLVSTITNFMGWKDGKPGKSYAQAPEIKPDNGEYLFKSRCGACHTIGHGDGVGPDLAGLTTRRERGWVARYLKVPEQMLAEKDPIATELNAKYKDVPMPNLRLADSEIATLLSFLEGRTDASHEHNHWDSMVTR